MILPKAWTECEAEKFSGRELNRPGWHTNGHVIGGTQDVWDIRELLRLPEAQGLIVRVSEALLDQPQAMRDLWEEALSD